MNEKKAEQLQSFGRLLVEKHLIWDTCYILKKEKFAQEYDAHLYIEDFILKVEFSSHRIEQLYLVPRNRGTFQ